MAKEFNRQPNRKIVTASTENNLKKKIADNETRDWKIVGRITQHYVGQWCCVMERNNK